MYIDTYLVNNSRTIAFIEKVVSVVQYCSIIRMPKIDTFLRFEAVACRQPQRVCAPGSSPLETAILRLTSF